MGTDVAAVSLVTYLVTIVVCNGQKASEKWSSVISWTMYVNNGPKKSPCQVSNFGAKCRVATPSRLLWTMVKNTALSSVSQILALTGGLGSVTK